MKENMLNEKLSKNKEDLKEKLLEVNQNNSKLLLLKKRKDN